MEPEEVGLDMQKDEPDQGSYWWKVNKEASCKI